MAGQHRIGYRLHRLMLPRHFKHHAKAHWRFRLRDDPDVPGARVITWNGRVVGRTQPLESVRGSCDGACFIVCTGPSINDIDLGRLAGHACMGVNGAIVKFRERDLHPTQYVISDPDFFDDRFDMVRDVITSGADCFFSFAGLSRIAEREPALLEQTRFFLTDTANHRYGVARQTPIEFEALARRDPDLVLHQTVKPHDDAIGFSRNLLKGVFCGRNVAFRALQVARDLGYRRVFLLGMDLGGSGDLIRFYETREQGVRSGLESHLAPYIVPTFEVLRDLCRDEALEVYNLSAESRLPSELIPKISFDAALSMIDAEADRCERAEIPG
jgi:KDO transferase-3